MMKTVQGIEQRINNYIYYHIDKYRKGEGK